MHNPAMQFEFDPAKARSNLQKHPGVSFSHAEQSLRDDMAVTIEDPDVVGEQRFLTLGMDALGRILVVCHTQRDERTRIISARKASKNEAKNYYA
ncbi:MAG TPA: BrnT family toxin [Rhodoferax sp.]|nr:BrnT family toxin [Rhodoferax sp.]